MSNIREKNIPVQSKPLLLDSFSIVPGTFKIIGMEGAYFLDPVKSLFSWRVLPKQDSIKVQYRVFPFYFEEKLSRYNYDSIADFFKAAPKNPDAGGLSGSSEKFLDFGSLSYTGSFGRSLSFGNAQDAVVNSLFNLQINGMLKDSIEISAAITDNNIPILPDGTTQQLNEFDQIWLKFKKKDWQLNIGDIDMREQPSYFMSYFKRQQGVAFKTKLKGGEKFSDQMTVSGAIAKGKFTRNIFNGQEANQGPYRLKGANNEFYFIVLPGTERVFVDGIQQQRGEDQEYIINYNTAEITFTPRQLINKDKRIQVEFEYADRNYLNSLIFFGNEMEIGKKLSVNLAYYANTDAKNSPINQSLDVNQKQFLSEIGDSISKALYPSAMADTFDVNKILYIKKDTVVNGVSFSIFQYSSVASGTMYNVSFSDFGAGKGNYIPLFNASNGKAFQWIAPVNGQPQGSFEPVQLLVTPKQQQQITAAVKYSLSNKTILSAEGAFSNVDLNRFSSRDKENDGGVGIKVFASDKRVLKISRNKLDLQSRIGYESVDANFRPLERLRNIEFLRDWGLPFDAVSTKEKIPEISINLSESGKQQFGYQYLGYFRGDGYKGNRHHIEHKMNIRGWQLIDQFNLTLIESNQFKGYFLRPKIALSKKLEKLDNYETGLSYGLEHNDLKEKTGDTLLPVSFSFRDWNAYIRSNSNGPNKWGLTWFNRANQLPTDMGFKQLDINNTWSAFLDLQKNQKHQWRVQATFRDLRIKDTQLTNIRPEKSLIGRAEYQVNILKGAMFGVVLYELGAGQEQRKDFSYVEVPAGRGEYNWIDYNNDGVPQLNEFEVAQFQDQAKYIRLFTATNDFIRASYNTFNYSFQFTPRLLWRTSQVPFQKFLAKWSFQSSLQTNSKRENDGTFQFNPFTGNADDTTLIAFNINLANTLSFNRYSTQWGIDLTQVKNKSRSILTYGLETREINDYSLKFRKNFGRKFTSEISSKIGRNDLATPNPKFDNRNYQIKRLSIEPKISYTNGTVFRTSASYQYSKKDNQIVGTEQRAILNSFITEAKYNVVQSSVLTGKMTYTNIAYTGPANTPSAFIMLDALQPGNNFIWNIEFTKRLANSFELSFNYEGRKPGEANTIHIGRAAIRAIL